ncbi:MAG: class I SAM-dependent methyltransferase [Flavobacteriia bacterium]
MIEKKGDPVGAAILDYTKTRKPDDIIVSSDICEDDVIPVEVLFRNQNEMPDLELMALQSCKGRVLDVGAGAGAHSKELIDRGLDVDSIEISDGAVQYMKSIGLNAKKINFFDLKNEKYDTILMMMNGIGIAGKLSNLENTLLHAKNLLQPGGKILCDSSDIKYLYEDEDGALWVDLNSEYYGNFRFQMKFKKEKGPWFDWLYVDFENLFNAAKNVGLKAKKILDQDDHYLAEITLA